MPVLPAPASRERDIRALGLTSTGKIGSGDMFSISLYKVLD
jgi:hypothetical protein